MGTILQKLDKITGCLSSVGVLVGSAAVMLMIVMITINVVLRKTMGGGFLFVEEYSGYALVLIVYFGLGHALRNGKHIRMELLVRKLSPQTKVKIEVVTSTLCLLLLVYLLIKGIQFVAFSFRFHVKSEWYSESILWPFHLLIPTGLIVFIGEMAQYLLTLLRRVTCEDE
ncbi:MAG: hypothetical protein DRG83_12040 [Deltaproteobacteria bacterium]|nr:MAG: hypothetical protein DRG83_12040 [Deltaproteobacteria bacterium]